jgi:molecular chaperone GrpE
MAFNMVKNKKSMKEEHGGHKAGGKHAGEKHKERTHETDNRDNKNINAPHETNGTVQQEGKEGKSPETALEEKIKEQEDKYLRLAAEFDNYRKRSLREKAELIKLAGEEIFTNLLPVIDDMDRAMESMNNAGDMEAIKKGIQLIHFKFREFLKQKGVREIQAIGTEFDTDVHEAVTKIPAPSKKDKGKIVEVIEKGYILHDKVIRYAKVVVGE